MTTLQIQSALKASGFDPGPLDGAMGPLTRRAIMAFEAAHGLKMDGVADDAFLRLLLGTAGRGADWLPWLAEAERRKGLHERRDRAELVAFLRSDGATLGDPAALPWCGDFVGTCMALALPEEPLPANPYLARNWLGFGVPCAPVRGAVLVFWRGSPKGSAGHVGFHAGEDGEAFHVLGGNQSDSVSMARIARARLLGARWPRSVALPKPGTVAPGAHAAIAGGPLSTNEE